MTIFLKFVWGSILIAIVGALITFTLVGIPAPTVQVKKQIPIENIIK